MAFCLQLRDYGVKTVIYTDIARDGALTGANIPVYQRLSQIADLDIVASGGISSLAEIEQLRDMGISAAILGLSLIHILGRAFADAITLPIPQLRLSNL